MKIPKKVYLTWNDCGVVNLDHPMINKGVQSLIDLNPDWEVEVFDNNDVNEYMQANMPAEYWELIKDAHIVEKTDVWRMLKLYREGGIYVDIDRWCNKKLSDIIPEDAICVLPTCEDTDFSQDIMISAPASPILDAALQAHFQRREEGHTSVYFLGPQTYMHAVTHTLFGEVVDTNPGAEVFNQMRDLINRIDGFYTYRESPPSNTFLYEGEESWDEWEAMKRSFYADQGIKHWTGEW